MTKREIISVGDAEATVLARALRSDEGVLSVLADPVRRQLVVRYAATQTTRRALWRHRQLAREASAATRLLSWWPRLSRIPSVIAALI